MPRAGSITTPSVSVGHPPPFSFFFHGCDSVPDAPISTQRTRGQNRLDYEPKARGVSGSLVPAPTRVTNNIVGCQSRIENIVLLIRKLKKLEDMEILNLPKARDILALCVCDIW